MYGVFGYIKLNKYPHLILIEEASIVGQILRGTVYRVEKLKFIPINPLGSTTPVKEDKPFIEMIENV